MPNRSRLRTVAHALATRDCTDPLFSYRRYAVRASNPDGPDVPLAGINSEVLCDIAAFTCYQYPDLCLPAADGRTEIPAMFYWRNARRILGLTTAQADQLFLELPVTDGYVSVAQAIAALEKLATEVTQP